MTFELETYHRNVPDSELITDLRRVASGIGKNSVTRKEQDEKGSFNSGTFIKRFGTWFGALEKAGLDKTRTSRNLPVEYLFRNLEEVWTRLGRQPRYDEIHKPLSKYNLGTYENRFGSWHKALEDFVAYINEGSQSESDLLRSVPELPKEIKERGPRNPGRRLTMQVLIRDKGICQYCKRVATADGLDYHIDHITPWIKGGPTILSNLQLLCSKCNLLKGDLDLTDGTEG
jgi:hypothetical protein